ncbi:MAG: hypothetical protein ACI39U_09505, partial [Candidatus Cryptobacteroides sp.]
FHTTFNIINTLIMIWFTRQIESVVKFIIKDKPASPEDNEEKIKYLDYGLISTPELALAEANKEICHFGKIMKNSLSHLDNALLCSDSPEKYEPFRKKLVKYEEISDRIEYEIVNFLNDLNKDSLSEKSRADVRSLLRISGELESLGDSGEAISRTISNMQSYGRKLSAEHIDNLHTMIGLLSKAYEDMIGNLKERPAEIFNAIEDEKAINAFRDKCREKELGEIERKGDSYFETVFYLDILEEMEQMGDFLINISQAI